MTSSRAWWRARRAWQKAALLLLPVAVAAVVLAVVLDSRSAPSVAERPAAEVRPEEPDLSRGLVVFDGCSLVDDAGVARDAGMPAQVMALLPGGLDMKNLGVGGQTTQMMAADAGAEVDPLYAASRRCNILVCWEGTNDLILGTAPPYDARQAYRHLAAYCKARQRAGFRVVICTVLTRGPTSARTRRSAPTAPRPTRRTTATPCTSRRPATRSSPARSPAPSNACAERRDCLSAGFLLGLVERLVEL